ncbi:MAG: cytochrome b/b6 domain-containing protein [Myxococcales bacterium]|nr:cytochrome b/b6 domain-containing protein [Myxococcales bacterium]
MNTRWSTASLVLHWVSAALIVGLLGLGFVMTDLAAESGSRLMMSRLHTALGLTLMFLTVSRLVVRSRGGRPAPLPLAALHRRGVGVVHGLLYATVFALGASGAFTGARSAWPDYLRGSVSAAPKLEQLASRQVHEALVFVLLTLIVLHVGGVLVQEVRRGGVLRRMIPWLRASPASLERELG